MIVGRDVSSAGRGEWHVRAAASLEATGELGELELLTKGLRTQPPQPRLRGGCGKASPRADRESSQGLPVARRALLKLERA